MHYSNYHYRILCILKLFSLLISRYRLSLQFSSNVNDIQYYEFILLFSIF